MSALTILDGKLRVSGVLPGDSLILARADDTPCCCQPKKICWRVAGGCRDALFSAQPDDADINGAEDDLSVCAVFVDYFVNRCNAYPYFSPSAVAEFLQNGGVYITNCEWTNCQSSGGCDPDGAAFGAQMGAIGASLSRGRGTVSTNYSYNPLGGNVFAGCTVSGNATAEISGGTPLLYAPPGSYCGSEPGGTCCAGSHVGSGAVIGFGDSNVNISGPIRDNLLHNLARNLF